MGIFGVHGIGDVVGALLTGVFASSTLGCSVDDLNIDVQLELQAIGVISTLMYSGALTFVLIKIVNGMIGIRMSGEKDGTGIDLSLLNERDSACTGWHESSRPHGYRGASKPRRGRDADRRSRSS